MKLKHHSFWKKGIAISASILSVSLLAFGCYSNATNNTNGVKTLQFYLDTAGKKAQTAAEWAQEITDTYNQTKPKDEPKIKINVNLASSADVKINRIKNNSADFIFLSVNRYMLDNLSKYADATIQTLTTAFNFDPDENARYTNGSFDEKNPTAITNDPLRKIADNINHMIFNQYPSGMTKDWANVFHWNGIRYNDFYLHKTNTTKEKLVSFYRGMIILTGTPTNVQKAIDAWNNKDFNSFRSLVISVGNPNNAGNYKLEELLIKKHFHMPSDWTIQTDRFKNPNDYVTSEYGTDAFDKGATIIFSDEGSFSWTPYNGNDYVAPKGHIIKILTATDPNYYDLGLFNKHLDQKMVHTLSQVIQNVDQKDKADSNFIKKYNDTYGASLGYNGFEVITNLQQSVFDKYNATFGTNYKIGS